MDRLYALKLLTNHQLITRVLALNAQRALTARAAALPALALRLSKEQAQKAGTEAPAPLSAPARQLLQSLYLKQPKLQLFSDITHPQVPPFNFDHPYDRLMLLNQAELNNLALYLGVSRLAPAISHIIRKSERAPIEAALAPQVLRFALEYARFSLEPQLFITTWPKQQALSDAPRLAASLGAELLWVLGPHFSAEDLAPIWQERLKPLLLTEQPPKLKCSVERLFKLCARILQ